MFFICYFCLQFLNDEPATKHLWTWTSSCSVNTSFNNISTSTETAENTSSEWRPEYLSSENIHHWILKIGKILKIDSRCHISSILAAVIFKVMLNSCGVYILVRFLILGGLRNFWTFWYECVIKFCALNRRVLNEELILCFFVSLPFYAFFGNLLYFYT